MKLHNPFTRDPAYEAFADDYLARLSPDARVELVEHWFMKPKPVSGFRLFTYFILGSGAVYVLSEAISRVVIAAKSEPDAPQHSRPFPLATAFAPPPDAPADDGKPETKGGSALKKGEQVLKEVADVAKAGSVVELLAV